MIIVFDGRCNLCNAAIHFIIERDKQAKFKFAAAQSSAGLKLQTEFGLNALDKQTLILLKNNNAYSRSSAAIRITRELDGCWKILSLFWIIPKPMRDFFYNFISKNRYKWFGKKDQCMVPSEDIKTRFLQ